MLQPVVLPSGGSFDLLSIRHWIKTSGTDPTTGAPLSEADLYPNLALRGIVDR